MKTPAVIEALGALAHEHRLAIYRLLVQRGPDGLPPLAQLKLIPVYGLPATFQILGAIFLVMTMAGAFLLRNPPEGYRPAG